MTEKKIFHNRTETTKKKDAECSDRREKVKSKVALRLRKKNVLGRGKKREGERLKRERS